MFCQSCGKEISNDLNFCIYCGSPITRDNSSRIRPPLTNYQTKSKINKWGIVASVAILLSAFLPYVSVSFLGSTMSICLMDSYLGYLFIVLASVGVLFSLIGFNIILIIDGVASTVIFFVVNSNLGGSDDDALSQLAASMLQKSVGYYLLLLGSIGLIAAGIYGWYNTRYK